MSRHLVRCVARAAKRPRVLAPARSLHVAVARRPTAPPQAHHRWLSWSHAAFADKQGGDSSDSSDSSDSDSDSDISNSSESSDRSRSDRGSSDSSSSKDEAKAQEGQPDAAGPPGPKESAPEAKLSGLAKLLGSTDVRSPPHRARMPAQPRRPVQPTPAPTVSPFAPKKAPATGKARGGGKQSPSLSDLLAKNTAALPRRPATTAPQLFQSVEDFDLEPAGIFRSAGDGVRCEAVASVKAGPKMTVSTQAYEVVSGWERAADGKLVATGYAESDVILQLKNAGQLDDAAEEMQRHVDFSTELEATAALPNRSQYFTRLVATALANNGHLTPKTKRDALAKILGQLKA